MRLRSRTLKRRSATQFGILLVHRRWLSWSRAMARIARDKSRRAVTRGGRRAYGAIEQQARDFSGSAVDEGAGEEARVRVQPDRVRVEECALHRMRSAEPLDRCQLTAVSLQARLLDGCMQQLEPAQRQAVALAYLRDQSHSEIAETLTVPLGTVKSWIRRGLAKLKSCLGGGL